MSETPKSKNIFEQILYGLEVTNNNVVEVSKDIAVLLESIAELKSAILPSTAPDGTDTPFSDNQVKE